MADREEGEPVRIVAHPDCRGRSWVLAPTRRTIFYSASLPAAAIADAISEAVDALGRHHARPHLQLVAPSFNREVAS
jgi:hypothetical protein